MASFDFVESAAAGYKFLIREHAAIGQLAVVPLVMKIVSLVIVIALDWGDNILRSGLLLLPATFAEGWLVARLIRMDLYGERGPVPLTGNQKMDLILMSAHARILTAAMVIYALIELGKNLFYALLTGVAGSVAPDSSGAEPSMMISLLSLALVGFMLWSFRFLWLFVPVAMDIPLRGFLHKIRGVSTSVFMLATWILCFVPIMMLSIMTQETLMGGIAQEADISSPALYLNAVVQSCLLLVLAVVSGVAMARGVADIYREDRT